VERRERFSEVGNKNSQQRTKKIVALRFVICNDCHCHACSCFTPLSCGRLSGTVDEKDSLSKLHFCPPSSLVQPFILTGESIWVKKSTEEGAKRVHLKPDFWSSLLSQEWHKCFLCSKHFEWRQQKIGKTRRRVRERERERERERKKQSNVSCYFFLLKSESSFRPQE